MDLQRALPQLLPAAVAWAERRAKIATEVGDALTDPELAVARAVGVSKPELVRVEMVESLPLPEDASLRAAALQAGLLGPGMSGLTLGYAMFICHGHKTRRLLAHELRHVHQYEQHGSISGFLPLYLTQIVEVGYRNAPFEADARAHEMAAYKGT